MRPIKFGWMLLAGSLWASPIQADTPAPSPIEDAVCMASPAGEAPNGLSIIAILPPTSQQTLADRGFTVVPCIENPVAASKYRQQVCAAADKMDAAAQDTAMRAYHVTPHELCNFAVSLGL